MVDRSELITVCRQIGGMMQAGVDILRITRVLRAQTDNPRLLQLYDALDHDLTMGRSLVDAMERAPDVWSPFIISLVQQGEDRNDLAGAFLNSADYLQKEGELEASTIATTTANAATSANEPAETDNAAQRNEYLHSVQTPAVVSAVVPPESLSHVAEALIGRLQSLAVSVLLFATALFLAWAIVWWTAGAEILPLRWVFFALCSVSALLFGGAAVWLQNVVETRRYTEPELSSSGHGNTDGANLHAAPDTRDTEEAPTFTAQDGENGSGEKGSGLASSVSSEATFSAETGAISGIINQSAARAASSGENAQTSTGAPAQIDPEQISTERRPLSPNGTLPQTSARTRTPQAEEDYE